MKNFTQWLSRTKEKKQCYGSALVSMRIRIVEAKSMRIHADPDPDQTLLSQKVEFDMKNIPAYVRYKSLLKV
jgi:hypothetical protein